MTKAKKPATPKCGPPDEETAELEQVQMYEDPYWPPLPERFTNGGATREERDEWIAANWGPPGGPDEDAGGC